MIILIAPEKDVTDEILILHQLFDKGLKYYHLRKPLKSEKEYRRYLEAINVQFYDRVVIHQYHHLAEEYGLKGVHLQEQFRVGLAMELQNYQDYYRKQINKRYTVSSSFHHPNDIEKCIVEFDYHLLSPVFNSISKQGYEGKGFSVNGTNKTIIGMGGVTATNLNEINQKGYKGVGVLGGVWNTNSPVKAFEEMVRKSPF